MLYYLGRASGLLSKQSIDTLLAAYPDSARAHQAMAENYFVLRQMPQAEKEFLEALRLRPDTPELHLELGLVYAGSAQWPKAEEEFRAQTKLQPGNAEGAYRLGTALLQQGKAREARIELQRADRLQPEMPETLYSLGKAAALAGDPAAAEKAWTKLLSIEKGSSSLHKPTSRWPASIANREKRRKPSARPRSFKNYKVLRLNQKGPIVLQIEANTINYAQTQSSWKST